MMQAALPRVFTVLLALLLASFFFVPEQHQRNWFLYLAAAAAHGFLFDRQALKGAFSGPAGWAVPALLAIPLLSLAWSESVSSDTAGDLLVAGYCILMIYLGVAYLVRRRPQDVVQLKWALLLAANLGALLSLGHWAASYDSAAPRLTGALGLDNPVHGSIQLLAVTLPVWNGIAERRLRLRWLCACIAPLAFALLAGPRTALAAYALVAAFALRVRFRPATIVTAALVAGIVGVAALFGSDALKAIWLDRGLSFRPQIWAQAWSAYLDCNPLIGCGIGTPLAIEYIPEAVTDRAHSLYVAAIYHQGVLGTLVFLAVFVRLLGGPRLLFADRERQVGRPPGGTSMVNARRDFTLMLAFVLIASATSGDHIVVRTTLFWCYFWLPVMVLTAAAGGWVSERENSPADPA